MSVKTDTDARHPTNDWPTTQAIILESHNFVLNAPVHLNGGLAFANHMTQTWIGVWRGLLQQEILPRR